jgi:hypothetical protein
MMTASTRRAGALALAFGTALLGGMLASPAETMQPVVLPVAFGVALATAIDPTRWLLYLIVVGTGLAGFDIVPDLSSGRPLSFSSEVGSVLSVMVPAFVGAAMVRLAWRQAI